MLPGYPANPDSPIRETDYAYVALSSPTLSILLSTLTRT